MFFPADATGAVGLEVEQVSTESQSSIPVAVSGEKILIVDDEQSVRMVMEQSLCHLGYEVSVANGASEALSFFGADGSGYSLVILDMIMPEVPGDQLFYQLKEIKNDVSVLIASGFSNEQKVNDMISSGAKGIIRKPFSIEELASRVRSCLDT